MDINWRSTSSYLFLLSICIFVFLGYVFFNLLVIISLSFMIAYLLRPLQLYLNKCRIPNFFSTFILLIFFICLVSILGVLFTSLISHSTSRLIEKYPVILQQLQEKIAPILAYFSIDIKNTNMFNLIKEQIPAQANNIANILFLSFKQSGGIIAVILSNIILLPVITFYFLLDWDVIKLKTILLIPKKHREKTSKLTQRVSKLMLAYSKGQIILVIVLSFYYSISLNLINLEKATAIGLFTGCAILVPYVGFACGLALALLIGVLQYGFTAHIVYIVLIYSIGQVVESFILTPRLVGESIGLHPITVILSLIVFGQLLGFIGLLFALPIAAVLQILAKESYRHYRSTV